MPCTASALRWPTGLATLLLAACSGGSDSAPIRTAPPQLRLLSPRVADTDAATTVLRGTSDAPLASVSLEDGREAISTDGFLSWSIEVALAPGTNRFVLGGRSADGRATQTLTVERERPTLLLNRVSGLAADPLHPRLACFTIANAVGLLELWGPALDVTVVDLDRPTPTGRTVDIGTGFSTFTPRAQLQTMMDAGTRLHFLLSGYSEACLCTVARFVDLTFDGPRRTLPAPGLLDPRSRVHTGRPDEFAGSWPDGFGVSGTDPRNRLLWVPSDAGFQPGAVTRGADDSTFFVADTARPTIWLCLRDNAAPMPVTSDLVGSGPDLGLVTSLAFLPSRRQLAASSDRGLFLVDLFDGTRRLLDESLADTELANAGGRLFVNREGGVEEVLLDAPSEPRPRLGGARNLSGIDWSRVVAVDHEPGSRRILLATDTGVRSLDLDTGELELETNLFGLSGPVAVDAKTGRIAFVVDGAEGDVVRVMDRQRQIVGERASLRQVTNLTFDEENGRVVYVSRAARGSLEFRATTFEPTNPTAHIERLWNILATPQSICAADNVVWAARGSAPNAPFRVHGVFRIALTTGFTTQLADPPVNDRFARSMVLDPASRQLAIALHGELTTRSLEGGLWVRRQGTGPEILEPTLACALDGQSAVLVVDRNHGALFHVDLVTEERTLLPW